MFGHFSTLCDKGLSRWELVKQLIYTSLLLFIAPSFVAKGEFSQPLKSLKNVFTALHFVLFLNCLKLNLSNQDLSLPAVIDYSSSTVTMCQSAEIKCKMYV